MPRDRTGDLVNSGERTPGEVVAPMVEFVPVPEPLARSYDWAEELERQRAENFWPRGPQRASRPQRAGYTHRSLRRV
jgi:hypothetical protein